MKFSNLIKTLIAGLWLCLTMGQTTAQTWPDRPLSMIVPWPAGGPSDFVARRLQPDLAKALGQPVVIDNIGGASGAIGVQKNASAPADGNTFSLVSPIELIVAPLTLTSVKYKSDDFKLVGQVVKAPMVLLARKDLPANTIDELLALLSRSNAKPLSLGNGGNGSLFHLVGVKLEQQLGAEFIHVPYKGATPMMTDLMGGQVDLAFTVFAGSIPYMVAEGKVKAIGLATRTPSPKFPQIAPLAVHPKLTGFEFDSWAGIVVPRKTPDTVANRINKAVYDALQNPDTRIAFESTGNTIVNATSVADLDSVFRDEIARYQAIAKSIKFEPQ